jgi:hypothetical protein
MPGGLFEVLKRKSAVASRGAPSAKGSYQPHVWNGRRRFALRGKPAMSVGLMVRAASVKFTADLALMTLHEQAVRPAMTQSAGGR